MEKKIYENKLLTFYIIILSSAVWIRDIGGINIPKIIFIALCAVVMCVANKENLIYLIVFTIPFLCGLPGTYIMLIALLLLLIKMRKVNSKAVLILLFATGMEVFSTCFLQGNYMTILIQYISYLGVLVLLIYDDTDIDYRLCLKVFNLGVIIVSVAIAVMTFKSAPDNWHFLFSKGWFRIGDTQVEENSGMMLVLNANSLAYFCLVGISCSLVLLDSINSKREKIISIVEICIFILIAAMTNSRSFLFLLAFILILFMRAKSVSIKGIIATIIVVVVIMMAGWTLLKNNIYIMEGILGRFNDSTMGTAGGRTQLFSLYLEKWSDNLRTILFGAGVSGYNEVYKIEGSVHNGLLQFIVCYGVVGSIVMLFVFLKPVISGMRKKVRLIYFLPVLAVVAFTQTIQFLNPCFLMLPFMIGVFAIKEGEK